MFDRLEDTVNRYEDITAELGNPDVVNDQEKFRKLMKEQSSLAPLIETYTEYKNCKKNIEDSLAILDEETDEELKEMAKEELNESKARVEELEHELKILLLPKDPNDDKDIVVEIRAGAGGEEAALFAAELFRMYVHYAQARGWKVEVLSGDETGIGGMKEVEFMVKGQGAYSIMKYESGVHRVQYKVFHASGILAMCNRRRKFILVPVTLHFQKFSKIIQLVHACALDNGKRQVKGAVLRRRIPVDEKILRIVCGNADAFHSRMKLLCCGRHGKPHAARFACFKAAAAVDKN